MRALAVALAALLVVAAIVAASSNIISDGTITAAGDITSGDDMIVPDDLSVGGTATFDHYSCAYIVQDMVTMWDLEAGTGKADGDTFFLVTTRPFWVAPVAGTIESIYMLMEAEGSGWDSLVVDVYAGDSADSAVCGKTPKLTPAAGALSTTLKTGRNATMNGTISATVEAGEVFQLHVETFGSKGDEPVGLKVLMRLRPDYGN